MGRRRPATIGRAIPVLSLCAFALWWWCLASLAFASDWSVHVGNKTVYTDNVFEFSAARRLALSEDPSQPSLVGLTRPSDFVWEPYADVTKTFTVGGSRTDISAKAQGFLFTDNSSFNHGMYRLQARHYFSDDTSILVRYRYTPDLLLGPNTERRTGLRLLDEERVTSHAWRMQVEQRLSQDWTATLIARYGLRRFNAAFAERDTNFWTIGPQVSYRGIQRLVVTAGYLYEDGRADGRQDIQYRDDVSYRQHVAVAGATVTLTERLSLDLGYFYRRKLFTSTIVGDSNNGTQDTTHQGSAEFAYRLSDAWRLSFGFQRTQRDSNRSQRGFFSDNVSVGVDFLY
ncbi:MAG: hypothetical protein U0172_12815 [Nitrospiraceae bacterium]